MILKPLFFQRSALKVAQQLLGCFLIRKLKGQIIKTKIVETEAYDGLTDSASHASGGKTERNQVMFGSAGIFYVYFTYGLHYMLNIVTGDLGYPAAVLIRAVEPIKPANLLPTNGPARLTKSLQINKSFNGRPAYTKKYGLWLEAGQRVRPEQIVKTTRIGVDYAGQYKNKLWRFYFKNNQFVSKK